MTNFENKKIVEFTISLKDKISNSRFFKNTKKMICISLLYVKKQIL